MVDAPKRNHLLFAIAVVIVTFPLVPLFAYLGRPASGPPAYFMAMMILMAIRARWDLRRWPWFWTEVALFIVIQAALVMFVPWSGKWVPPVIKVPLCFADFIVMLSVINLTEKFLVPASGSTGNAELSE